MDLDFVSTGRKLLRNQGHSQHQGKSFNTSQHQLNRNGRNGASSISRNNVQPNSANKARKGNCYKCGRGGHYARECRANMSRSKFNTIEITTDTVCNGAESIDHGERDEDAQSTHEASSYALHQEGSQWEAQEVESTADTSEFEADEEGKINLHLN